jgi:hypothetical protein
MAKRPENMTPEERLTRIRSLERKVSLLEHQKYFAEREMECTRLWAEKAWEEIRRLEAVCTRHWNEKNEYRKAAGLAPFPRTQPVGDIAELVELEKELLNDCPSSPPN